MTDPSHASSPAPHEDTARSRMEALIAAMRRPAAAPAPDTIAGGDERLAVAARRAIRDEPTVDAAPRSTDAALPHLEHGTRVGRYVVLQRLGAGGMGVVHAAYDPELDRKVALKLVHPRRAGEEHQLRLLREAQALAKLSHRHVVTVFDVGTMGEHVWMVMELVRGQTLRQWLCTPRSWREVLAVLLPAGRGLAAAHAAGLVHRDFKPDNVMIDDDGDVRVMDFDLARTLTPVVTPEPGAPHDGSMPTTSTRTMPVTRADVLVGTPGYMAPEQLLGLALGPAVDQFALCVTLWEALYGERPFPGRAFEAQVDGLLAGQLHRPRQGRAAPAWLRRVCERGLRVRPQERFESMETLLAALERGRARARWRAGAATVGALATCVAGVGAWRQLDLAQRVAACEATGDEIESAWSPARAQVLREAFVATGVSHAETTAEKVRPWLDQHAQAWREARVATCLDTEVYARWDAETVDRSRWCLEDKRDQLQGMVDGLLAADADVVQHAVTSVLWPAAVEQCRDPRALAEVPPPPVDDRAAVRAVSIELGRANALMERGRIDEGLALARECIARAEAIGWAPLVSGVRLQLGALLRRAGQASEAEAMLEDAYFDAVGVVPEAAFDAGIELSQAVGEHGREADARRWLRHAEEVLALVTDQPQLRRSNLLSLLGQQHHTDDPARAKALYEQALAIREAALGSHHPYVAIALNDLALAHHAAGDAHAAAPLQRRALAIQEETLGPEHPHVATSLHNLAEVVRASGGSNEEAKALHARSLAIRERALGPEHPQVAMSLVKLGRVYEALGSLAEARASHERALATYRQALGQEHPEVGHPLVGLASVALAEGRPVDAAALARQALAVWEPDRAPPSRLAQARFVLARALWDAPADPSGDRSPALALAEQARDAYRAGGVRDAAALAGVEQWLRARASAAHVAEPSPEHVGP